MTWKLKKFTVVSDCEANSVAVGREQRQGNDAEDVPGRAGTDPASTS
jgi:hypothetical protein